MCGLSFLILHEMGVGVPELPCVASRYGTNSAFCAVLVTLQRSSIPYSVVEAEKINSFKMVVDKSRDALSGLPE